MIEQEVALILLWMDGKISFLQQPPGLFDKYANGNLSLGLIRSKALQSYVNTSLSKTLRFAVI